MSSTSKNVTMDEKEYEMFKNLSYDWWNNPQTKVIKNSCDLLAPYICTSVQEHFIERNLNSLRILEVGCGGGFLTEGLSRAGFNIIAIDINKELVEVAKTHMESDPDLPKITYLVEPIEEHCVKHFQQYDVVISNFVLEHVSDHDHFIKCCSDCVKPGGLLFMSAVAKTFLSWFYTIFLGERILRLVPPGLHDYHKCISAPDTERIIKKYNFKVKLTKGMIVLNPYNKNVFFCPTNQFAYVVLAVRNTE